MRLRAVLGSAVLSVGCVVVNADGAAASPTVQRLSVVRLEAVWDAGDGTPVLALQVFDGTFDTWSGAELFIWASIVLPTGDGTLTTCMPAGTLDVDASLSGAAVSGSSSCADGRSLTVDLHWTASGAPKGSGSGLTATVKVRPAPTLRSTTTWPRPPESSATGTGISSPADRRQP